jgi:hypothetical protein
MFREKLYSCNSPRYKKTNQMILNLLARKSMSKHELCVETGLNNSTIANYLYFMREKNLIYICAYEDNPVGKPTPRFRFGVGEDVTYIAKPRTKAKKGKSENYSKLKMPRCDVAAEWMKNPIC